LTRDELNGSLELQWINKDKSLLYEIDENEGTGIKPQWIEKNNINVSEPRILKLKGEYGDLEIENILIKGDNLIALRSLVEKFKTRDEKDKVKCVYIDPPFNTGAAFEHYDDNLEHSQWLTMMKDRLILLQQLLREDGAIFVHLDDKESSYCKLLLDEVFGRSNYCNEIILSTNQPFGYKSTADSLFKQANHILFYAKNKNLINIKKIVIEKEYDKQYKFVFKNINIPKEEWEWDSIHNVVAKALEYDSPKKAIENLGKEEFSNRIALFAIENAERVFRTASVTGGALLKRKETIELSRKNKEKIILHPNDDMDYMFIGGERVIFYKERLCLIDDLMLPGEIITDIWTDIPLEGIAKEGGVDFPKAKKPEKLLKRIIEMTTESRTDKILNEAFKYYLKDNPGKSFEEFKIDTLNQTIYINKVDKKKFKSDLVLDSFAGSGTTAAVAHKLGRNWIIIEIGNHAETHCIERLKGVIDKKNPDNSGISKDVDWKGGGGFRYYVVGDSVLSSDDMNWQLNFVELSEAVFMNFGFSMIKEPLVEGVFVGKSRKIGRFALCTITRDIDIITQDEMNCWLRTLQEKQGKWSEVEFYTNKGVGIRSDMLPEGVVLKKIPESLLTKYNL
jgi:adenine-specific DNA-methyltransferase